MKSQPFCLAAVAAVLLVVSSAPGSDYLPSDNPKPMALRKMDLGRVFDATTSGVINASPRVKKPPIVTRAEWGGGPSSGTEHRHFPSRLTIHHEGSPKPLTPDQDPSKLLRNLQVWGWNEKKWPDVPYHFLIDLDGNIYEGRDPLKAGDTNTTYDPTGHLLVTAMGNYELQAPTQKQIDAFCDLIAWACDYYGIDPSTIAGHMDYVRYTDCPGRYLYPYVSSGFIEGEVRKRIRDAYVKDISSTATKSLR